MDWSEGSSWKRQRVDGTGYGTGYEEEDPTEMLNRLQSAVQGAISSVAMNMMTENPPPMPEPPKPVAPAPPPQPDPAKVFLQPNYPAPDRQSHLGLPLIGGPDKVNDLDGTGTKRNEPYEKVKNRVIWLNNEGGLDGRIDLEKTMEIVPFVDFTYAMKVLRDVEEKKFLVKDPTAYITSAYRRVAGNDASPYSVQLFKAKDIAVVKIDPNTDPALMNLQFQMMQAVQSVNAQAAASQAAQDAAKKAASQQADDEAIPDWLPPGQKAIMRKQLAAKRAASAPSGSSGGDDEVPAWLPPAQAAMMRKQIAERKRKEAASMPLAVIPEMPLQKSPEELAAEAEQERTVKAQQMSVQVAALYQHCEEQSQAALSAQELAKGWVQAEDKLPELELLTHTANQSAQRSAWAVGWLDTTFPANPADQSESAVWLESMRQIIRQNTEKVGAAAQECIQYLCDLKNKIGIRDADGNKVKIKVKLKTCHAWTKTKFCAKGHLCTFAHGEDEIGTPQPILSGETKVSFVPAAVPCKFFSEGVCREGDKCEFSHAEFQPIPKEAKRPVECAFFQAGTCKRGNACIFAHGPDELNEIVALHAASGIVPPQ